MNAICAYLDNLEQVLSTVRKTQSETLETGAHMLYEAVENDHSAFAFGCSHAGLLALEMYYRSGGMATINPIRAPGLCLDIDPATMTSEMERLPGYGRLIIDSQPIQANDVVIIHSVSGRNIVPVDAALRCRELGAKVIALTNLSYSQNVSSRHPSGLRLFETADLVLDNCGCTGDGSLTLPGLSERVGPTSTAIGAAMLNAMMCRAVELIVENGGIAPVFLSANIDGGDAHNREMLQKYGKHIFYMGH